MIEFEVRPHGVVQVTKLPPYDGSLLAVAERMLTKVRIHDTGFGSVGYVDEMEWSQLALAVLRERERACCDL